MRIGNDRELRDGRVPSREVMDTDITRKNRTTIERKLFRTMVSVYYQNGSRGVDLWNRCFKSGKGNCRQRKLIPQFVLQKLANEPKTTPDVIGRMSQSQAKGLLKMVTDIKRFPQLSGPRTRYMVELIDKYDQGFFAD